MAMLVEAALSAIRDLAARLLRALDDDSEGSVALLRELLAGKESSLGEILEQLRLDRGEPFASGLRLLADARRSTSKDRKDRLCLSALERFVEASTRAPEPHSRVLARICAGYCHHLSLDAENARSWYLDAFQFGVQERSKILERVSTIVGKIQPRKETGSAAGALLMLLVWPALVPSFVIYLRRERKYRDLMSGLELLGRATVLGGALYLQSGGRDEVSLDWNLPEDLVLRDEPTGPSFSDETRYCADQSDPLDHLGRG